MRPSEMHPGSGPATGVHTRRAARSLGLLLLVAPCLVGLLGCPSQEVISTLDDFLLQESDGGVTKAAGGEFDYALDLAPVEVGYTKVGESSAKLVPIENAGGAGLVLTDAVIYLHLYSTDSEGEEVVSGTDTMQSIFTFEGGSRPDFPVTIPAGGTFEGLYLTFTPETNGSETGLLVIKTEVGDRRVYLSGTGAFRLQLSVSAGQEGAIVEPVEVASGETVDYWATTTEVAVEATGTDSLGLSALDEWILLSDAGTAEIADPESLITTISVYTHAAVQAAFDTPYLFVDAAATGANDGTTRTDAFTSFAAAVNALDPDVDDGIVVAGGTYPVTSNVTLKKTRILAGYNSGFTARGPYQTAADRASATYGCTISLQNAELQAGSDVDATTILEGFTITGGSGTTSGAASLRVEGGSSLVVRYNTISGPAEGYALYVSDSTPSIQYNILSTGGQTDDSVVLGIDGGSPVIQSNTITAGGGGTRSVGIHVYDDAEPTISDNTITAGNPTGSGSESIGIYIDANYSLSPVATITGNTIRPGASADTSGGKSYGIYCINNPWPVIEANSISGGSGAAAYALCFGYAVQPTIRENALYTEGGSLRRGILVKANGRIRVLETNNFYECPDGLVYAYDHGEYTLLSTIDEVNEEYLDSIDRLLHKEKLNTNEEP